ncbi:MAG: biopolymer transporter ExbD [Phycisphaerales bacterium]|nr:biopolymer transporter ExbD [Phycisphaerales bacterium]
MPEDSVAPVNATPLIDVVLCMIVFFLIVGRLAETQRTPMRLPESSVGSAQMPPDSFVVNIIPGEGGVGAQVIVNNADVGFEGIEPALRERLERQPNVVVQIRAPRDAPYGLIEPALEACAKAGAPEFRLATERAGGGL